jgi:diazepam-binding inhibitor (GABA receptor modulator, acyl-CoA-binding protein)
MDLKQEFTKAAAEVQKLSQRPSTEDLLELYALYKQATEGDVKGSRPGLLDLRGRAKFDAWAKKKSVPGEKAMADYVALVRKLQS